MAFHNPQMSLLEGVISRGDRRLSGVISRVFTAGGRFDAWDNHFRYDLWEKAFQDSGLDPLAYLRERRPEAILPWDFLDVGVEKQSLVSDYAKAMELINALGREG